jgi:prepilin signal peptidase PulO-like enzyme (type II secretory pathway)
MINLLCGLVAMVIFSLFIGGLAFSIFDNTGSIAFPLIVAIVLLMAYAMFVEQVISKFRKK